MSDEWGQAPETVPVCGVRHQDLTGLEPCCLAPNHDGDHRYWVQGRKPDGDGWFIRTYGDDNMAVQFLEMKGRCTDEEVAALIQYLEFAR